MCTVTVAGAPAATAPAAGMTAPRPPIRRQSQILFMSHPFHEGLRACGRRQVSWLAGRPSRAFPGRIRAVPVAARCARVRTASPFTVAGPRRIHTGFPSPPTPMSISAAVYPEMWSPSTSMTVNLNRIYTKLGDGGETHLGDMSRVSKNDPRIEAYGTIDELNAFIGLALASGGPDEATAARLKRIQNDLFD